MSERTVFQFEKSVVYSAKARVALFGVSGSGKTFSALRIAAGLAEAEGTTVGVIDTENRRARKYSSMFDFQVLELFEPSLENYGKAIAAAEAAGIGVLVIDSLSHGWHKLLKEVDRIAKAKYSGNTWAAWSDANASQRDFISAILSYPGHVICTMRLKTVWEVLDQNGKKKPTRIGTEPVQGKDIEYEFDLLIRLASDHSAVVLKDTSSMMQDDVIEILTEEHGTKLAAWLSQGSPTLDATASIAQRRSITALVIAKGYDENQVAQMLSKRGYPALHLLTKEQATEILGKLAAAVAEDEKPVQEPAKDASPKEPVVGDEKPAIVKDPVEDASAVVEPHWTAAQDRVEAFNDFRKRASVTAAAMLRGLAVKKLTDYTGTVEDAILVVSKLAEEKAAKKAARDLAKAEKGKATG